MINMQLRCARCKGKSEHCERMMDLTVEIGGDISTLDEALLRFTSSETLDGENKYKCDRLIFFMVYKWLCWTWPFSMVNLLIFVGWNVSIHFKQSSLDGSFLFTFKKNSIITWFLMCMMILADRCNSYERAKKKLTILEAPNVLTIVLKRFQVMNHKIIFLFDIQDLVQQEFCFLVFCNSLVVLLQSDNFCKINKAIQFPEYLDLARYMSGDDKSPVYRLYAIIVHLNVTNTSSSGHYICYVKDRQGMWYEIDDSKVYSINS